MTRAGNCFQDVADRIIQDPRMLGADVIAVHGLPTGTGGDAEKVGVYPHAWLELVDRNLVYDCNSGMMIEKAMFYAVGNIEYTVTYTAAEFIAMANEHGHYGPWDHKILERDNEIEREHGI